jgi:uncharacterized protein YndB with AHSA1/START domain
MPTVIDSATSAAPPEEVWKLLYDPARFPQWWAGMERSEVGEATADGDRSFTYWYEGYPDFPMPQVLRTEQDDRRITISCLVSDVALAWRLEEAPGGGTRIDVEATLPEEEAARLDTLRESLGASVRRLAERAAATAAPPGRG